MIHWLYQRAVSNTVGQRLGWKGSLSLSLCVCVCVCVCKRFQQATVWVRVCSCVLACAGVCLFSSGIWVLREGSLTHSIVRVGCVFVPSVCSVLLRQGNLPVVWKAPVLKLKTLPHSDTLQYLIPASNSLLAPPQLIKGLWSSDLLVCVFVLLLQETNPLAGIMAEECTSHAAQTRILSPDSSAACVCNWYDWMMTSLS